MSTTAASASHRLLVKSVPHVVEQFIRAIPIKRSGVKSLRSLRTPDISLEYAMKEINLTHMKDYSRVCGFADPSTASTTQKRLHMPLTYPHMAVFPLQCMLMLDPVVPFPLMGMIHLANRIQLFDTMSPTTDSTDSTVSTDGAERKKNNLPHTANVRYSGSYIPHEKGLCSVVITEIHDASKNLLWREESTMLRRCAVPEMLLVKEDMCTSGSSSINNNGLYESIIKETDLTGMTDVEHWDVSGGLGRTYAAISGDFNPIHLTKLTAMVLGFPKGAIIHGMWTKARAIAALLPQEAPPKSVLDSCKAAEEPIAEAYVEFKTPLYVNSKAVLSVSGDKSGDTEKSNVGRCHKHVHKIFEVKGASGEQLPHLRGTVSWATIQE